VCRPTGLRPSSTFCEGHAIPVSSGSPLFSPGSLTSVLDIDLPGSRFGALFAWSKSPFSLLFWLLGFDAKV
jgi:hypothetical protein